MKSILVVAVLGLCLVGCSDPKYSDGKIIKEGHKVKHVISGREGVVLATYMGGNGVTVRCTPTRDEKTNAPREEFTEVQWSSGELERIGEFSFDPNPQDKKITTIKADAVETITLKNQLSESVMAHGATQAKLDKILAIGRQSSEQTAAEIIKLKSDLATANEQLQQYQIIVGTAKKELAAIRKAKQEAIDGLIPISSTKIPLYRRVIKR